MIWEDSVWTRLGFTFAIGLMSAVVGSAATIGFRQYQSYYTNQQAERQEVRYLRNEIRQRLNNISIQKNFNLAERIYKYPTPQDTYFLYLSPAQIEQYRGFVWFERNISQIAHARHYNSKYKNQSIYSLMISLKDISNNEHEKTRVESSIRAIERLRYDAMLKMKSKPIKAYLALIKV